MAHRHSGSLTQVALRRFFKNPLALAASGIVALMGGLATFGYLIAPDATSNANRMDLALAYKPIGFSVKILEIPMENFPQRPDRISTAFFGSPLRTEQLSVAKLVYHPENDRIVYTPYLDGDTSDQTLSVPLEKWRRFGITRQEVFQKFVYTKSYLLGTDGYGRDFLSRLILGTRISFFVGCISVLISLIVGVPLGAIAGYYRGAVDMTIMWLVNVFWSIPTLLLVMAIILALGKGFVQIFIAVGLTMWVEVARIVRGQYLSLREKEFVEAAKVLGCSDFRIIFKHILPNVWGVVTVVSAANFASAILIESGLSFLGIGAQPPTPSWGNIIKEHYPHLILGNAHLALIPGALIMLLVLAFMMIGNAWRDATDVKNAS